MQPSGAETSVEPSAPIVVSTVEHHSLLGKTLEQAFPNLTGSGIPEMFRAVAKGELKTQSFDMRYDGENIGAYFEVHVFRTSPRTIVVAFMNINHRVEAEDRLKKNQDELEAQVQRRTMQLRALAGELTMAEERERRRIAASSMCGGGGDWTGMP